MTEKPPLIRPEWLKQLHHEIAEGLRWSYTAHRKAQRDADVAYYEPIIKEFSEAIESWQRRLEQARQDTAREIFEEIESWKYVSPANLYQCTMNEIIEKLEQSLKEKFGVK